MLRSHTDGGVCCSLYHFPALLSARPLFPSPVPSVAAVAAVPVVDVVCGVELTITTAPFHV
jgi:hypothetical protein